MSLTSTRTAGARYESWDTARGAPTLFGPPMIRNRLEAAWPPLDVGLAAIARLMDRRVDSGTGGLNVDSGGANWEARVGAKNLFNAISN